MTKQSKPAIKQPTTPARFRRQVDEIVNLLTEKWQAHEQIAYYDIEMPYKIDGKPWAGRYVRGELIAICRALYKSHAFDHDFWEEFLSWAPGEAQARIRK